MGFPNLERFSVDGKLPRSVIVVSVDAVFFQRSRAMRGLGTFPHRGRMNINFAA